MRIVGFILMLMGLVLFAGTFQEGNQLAHAFFGGVLVCAGFAGIVKGSGP